MNKTLIPEKRTIAKKTLITSPNDGFLLGALISGEVRVLLNSKSHKMKSGEFILFKPNEKTEIKPVNKAEFMFLNLKTEILNELSLSDFNFIEKLSFVPYDVAIVHVEIKQFLTIKNILNRLLTIKDDDFTFGLDIYQNNLFSCLLILLLRSCILSDQIHQKNNRRQLMIDGVYLYIQRNINENLSLKQLELLFNVSGEHLSRKFKKETGLTIHEYITRTRIDLSKKYLLEDRSISEICQLVGFNSYNHFFKVFKKYTGLAPGDFLKKYR